jgi:uncharacterized protein (DUF1697 family)
MARRAGNWDLTGPQTYIGLLRAVNLGGSSKIRMANLVDLMLGAGFEEVRTLLQSGNLVFRTDERDTSAVESSIERSLEDRIDLKTSVFVRSDKEWRSILRRNPFPQAAESDPAHLVVIVLKDTPDSKALAELRHSIPGRETVEISGREAYIVYPDGIGRSKLTVGLIERKLKTRGTCRNWNTVRRLDQLASPDS